MRIRSGETHLPRGGIRVQALTAPRKPCLASMVNAIPFVSIDVFDTRERSRGIYHLCENTFAAVTKIQGEYIENLLLTLSPSADLAQQPGSG
jgi:hypothetical protein